MVSDVMKRAGWSWNVLLLRLSFGVMKKAGWWWNRLLRLRTGVVSKEQEKKKGPLKKAAAAASRRIFRVVAIREILLPGGDGLNLFAMEMDGIPDVVSGDVPRSFPGGCPGEDAHLRQCPCVAGIPRVLPGRNPRVPRVPVR